MSVLSIFLAANFIIVIDPPAPVLCKERGWTVFGPTQTIDAATVTVSHQHQVAFVRPAVRDCIFFGDFES